MSLSTPASATTDIAKLQQTQRRAWRLFLRRAVASPNVMIGGTLLLVFVVMTVAAPVFTEADPVAMSPRTRLMAPGGAHIFGTDDFGRDIFTRILYGGRLSLQVGLVSVSIGAIGGTLLGVVAGYAGRWVDAVIMRGIDVMLAFPGILLALVIVSILGRSLFNVMIAVGISSLPLFARTARGTTLAVREMDYVLAARALGSNPAAIVWRHVIPNILAPIIVLTTNGVAGAIIAGAALSFLGLGAQPPEPEWGLMLSQGREYLRSAWWITTFPGLAIMFTVMAINLLGDGLRDLLDPRLRT